MRRACAHGRRCGSSIALPPPPPPSHAPVLKPPLLGFLSRGCREAGGPSPPPVAPSHFRLVFTHAALTMPSVTGAPKLHPRPRRARDAPPCHRVGDRALHLGGSPHASCMGRCPACFVHGAMPHMLRAWGDAPHASCMGRCPACFVHGAMPRMLHACQDAPRPPSRHIRRARDACPPLPSPTLHPLSSRHPSPGDTPPPLSLLPPRLTPHLALLLLDQFMPTTTSNWLLCPPARRDSLTTRSYHRTPRGAS